MNRQAFKQRMQQLKTYRGENPGKTYLDFKQYQTGGEVPPTRPTIPDEPIRYKGKLIKDKYGKEHTEDQYYDYLQNGTDEISKFDGSPLPRGLKPLMDIEDAANMTPVGDVLSVKDMYTSVRDQDWTGLGLAAATLIPFIPSSIKKAGKSIKREIPKVTKNATQNAIDQYIQSSSKTFSDNMDYMSDIANEKNRIFENINTIPYRARAIQADKMFGTNYNSTYDVIDNLYEEDYFNLPEVSHADMPATARMQASQKAADNYFDTGVGAGPKDFDFKVNNSKRDVPDEVAAHELNHYTDYAISRNIDTATNNPMLKGLQGSLKIPDVNSTKYYRSGTEQKAYMNTLRHKMKKAGVIDDLDEMVDKYKLQKELDKLPESSSIKKAYKEHKSIGSYTKWFNSIPLLGIGATALYKNKEE